MQPPGPPPRGGVQPPGPPPRGGMQQMQPPGPPPRQSQPVTDVQLAGLGIPQGHDPDDGDDPDEGRAQQPAYSFGAPGGVSAGGMSSEPSSSSSSSSR